MNFRPSCRHAVRGSALITVLILMFMMALVSSSMLTYTMSERKGNERNRLILRAKNMAENITNYAAEQVTTKLFRLASAPVMKFPWTGSTRYRVYLPPDGVLDSAYTSHTTAELRAGIMAASGLILVTDTSDNNYGLQVNTARVPIIAKISASHPIIGTTTAYVEQDMAIALTPLFQFGMFYNMDLELYPSANFTLSGPVHTNGRLLAHPQGGSTASITFNDRVTAHGSLFANPGLKTVPRVGSGAEDPVTVVNGQVIFTHTNGTTQTSLKDTGTPNPWRDHTWKSSLFVESASSIASFKTWATSTYNGNLRTSAHQAPELKLPKIGTYKEQNIADDPDTDSDPTTDLVDERSNGREIIEPCNAKNWSWNYTTHTGSWVAGTDDEGMQRMKMSWRAGLYIMANPSASIRSGYTPDGTLRYVMPYSYRSFINIITDSTALTHTVSEVVLPGQPSYGYNNGADGTAGTGDDYMYRNYMPNRYDPNNTKLLGNQVLRMAQPEYGTASGYLVNGALALAATTIAVDTGTGPIPIGETVTIGAYKYLVTSALSGGSFKIAAPGIRDAAGIADNTPITVDVPSSSPGTGRDYQTNGALSAAATAVTVDTGSGTIPINNFVTIGANKYRVTATSGSPVTSITITPGLVAAVADNTPVTIDSAAGTVGTGASYVTSATGGAAGVNSLTFTTAGSGTILPGNIVTISSNKYLVTSALAIESGNSVLKITPALSAAANSTAVTVDATSGTIGTGAGYVISTAAAANATALAVNTGTGTVLTGNTIAIAGAKYLVTAATSGATVTSITITPGLAAAVAVGDAVFVDPFAMSGYSRTGGTGKIYPEDSASIAYPADAYFFDMRRANSNRGVISITGTSPSTTGLYDRFTVPYYPRPCVKIDFDMTRFKMMCDRVVSSATASTVYDLRPPNVTGLTWAASIYNSATTAAAASFNLGLGATFNTFPTTGSIATLTAQDPYQMYYVPSTPNDPAIFTNPTTFAVPASALSDASSASAWYDGIAVYVHSMDAEIRKQTVAGTPDRIDSGVRLWNGRGPVVSLSSAGKTGFAFTTNDAVYIVGHFNADGTINTTLTSTGAGGYSARYPDTTSEKLCAVMGDAYVQLSQPLWDSTSSGQTKGWNDAFSALPDQSSTAGWRTGANATAAIASGQDGVTIGTGYKPGLLPTNNTPAAVGTTSTTKLGAYDTEVSTALLVGIVPTNANPGYGASYTSGSVTYAENAAVTDGFVPTWSHTPVGDPLQRGNRVNAGGANNFPRLLENWKPSGTQTLWIRGSMVAMFESRVAMEPFTNSRCYNAPNRYWGLHENFRGVGHDLPLEPIVLGAYRSGFRELTAAEYATMKTTIEALAAP